MATTTDARTATVEEAVRETAADVARIWQGQNELRDDVRKLAQNVNERMDRIDAKLDTFEAKLDRLIEGSAA